ncbi:hypothetical protein V502_04126, partial [Pseudogymnoascus sp. VKM F-4520 (FW-2644)]
QYPASAYIANLDSLAVSAERLAWKESAREQLLKHATQPHLMQAYKVWEQRWSDATNLEFYNKDWTYVDLAKQVTSKDSAVPYDEIPEDHEAKVFLWKKCCLNAYLRTQAVLNVDSSKAKGNPKQTTYPFT